MDKKRRTLGVDESLLLRINHFIEEANKLDEPIILTDKKGKKKEIKKKEKLTSKAFIESAALFFIENNIDPRYYRDGSLSREVSKMRTHILGFITLQENKIIGSIKDDIKGLKNELSSLKKDLNEETIMVEATAMETQGTLMGVLAVLFEMLQIEESERTRLEDMVQVKGIEYLKKIESMAD